MSLFKSLLFAVLSQLLIYAIIGCHDRQSRDLDHFVGFVEGNHDRIFYVTKPTPDDTTWFVHDLETREMIFEASFLPEFIFTTPAETLLVKEDGLTGFFGGREIVRLNGSPAFEIEIIVLIADADVMALSQGDGPAVWKLRNITSGIRREISMDFVPEPVVFNKDIWLFSVANEVPILYDRALNSIEQHSTGFILSSGMYVQADVLREDVLCIASQCIHFEPPVTGVGEIAPYKGNWHVLAQMNDEIALYDFESGLLATEQFEANRVYRVEVVADSIVIGSIALLRDNWNQASSRSILDQNITEYGVYTVMYDESRYILRWNDKVVSSTVQPKILRRWGILDLRSDDVPLFVVESNGVTRILNRHLESIVDIKGELTSMATTWSRLALRVESDDKSEIVHIKW